MDVSNQEDYIDSGSENDPDWISDDEGSSDSDTIDGGQNVRPAPQSPQRSPLQPATNTQLKVGYANMDKGPTGKIRVIPFINLLLFCILMYLPISLTPWPLVWLYDKVIWWTDPFLMLAEIVLVQNYVMRYSQLAADKLESEEENAFKYKAVILIFSSLCYALAASMSYNIYCTATASQVLCLFVIIFILIAIHNMMWMAHEGIISDCAFVSLCSITILYTMVLEADQMSTPLPHPALWQPNLGVKMNVINIFYSILHVSTVNAQKSIQFLYRFCSPFFLGLLIVRLYSIIFIADKVTKNFFQGDDDMDKEITERSFNDDELDMIPMKSPFLLKFSVIFMLTQLSANFLNEWSGTHTGAYWLSSYAQFSWTSQVLGTRLMQVLAVNGFYMWRLYCADSWNWNPWLTPS